MKVHLDHGEINSMERKRGMRQGCRILPVLFNLYGERFANEASEVGDDLIKIINTIKCEDDWCYVERTKKLFKT